MSELQVKEKRYMVIVLIVEEMRLVDLLKVLLGTNRVRFDCRRIWLPVGRTN